LLSIIQQLLRKENRFLQISRRYILGYLPKLIVTTSRHLLHRSFWAHDAPPIPRTGDSWKNAVFAPAPLLFYYFQTSQSLCKRNAVRVRRV